MAAYLEAYPGVGYNSAGTDAWRLLKKAEVAAYIHQRREEMAQKAAGIREETLRYLIDVRCGMSKSEKLVTVSTGGGQSMVERVFRTPEERERLKAADMIAKCLCMYNEIPVGGETRGLETKIVSADDAMMASLDDLANRETVAATENQNLGLEGSDGSKL